MIVCMKVDPGVKHLMNAVDFAVLLIICQAVNCETSLFILLSIFQKKDLKLLLFFLLFFLDF